MGRFWAVASGHLRLDCPSIIERNSAPHPAGYRALGEVARASRGTGRSQPIPRCLPRLMEITATRWGETRTGISCSSAVA